MASQASIDVDQLQELVNEVRRTKRAQTLRLADDVIAVVMPEQSQDMKNAKRRRVKASNLPTTFTLESAFGSVPTPPHLKGLDIEAIIQEAKEDYAERLARE